jgi:hypothetical protein
MESKTKSMNTNELTQAVSHLLEQEEARAAQERRRIRRHARQRREIMEASITKLSQSIEVIKWCIIGITSVMAISLIIVILVVMEVEREAERIKGEVQGIQREAEMIREKIRHPLETLGGSLGRRLEGNIGELMDGSKSDK